jgi:EmrB/QacA subfamily drug resistance transporter
LKENEKTAFAPLMAVIFIGAFLATLSSSTINIVLPVLMKDFSSSLDIVKWTMTGFILAMGTVAPLTGFLGEKLSYKRLYILALIGFTTASLLCAISWNVYSLIAFRILQGCFSGLIAPSAMTIIYQIVPNKKQASALSIWSLASMLSPALGPTLGGWLIQNYNWQSIFIINLPLGILAVVMAVFLIPYYKSESTVNFDFPGLITCVAASLSLLIAFSEGAAWGWGSWKVIVLALAGLLFLGLFIFRELTAKSPMLNIRVLKYKTFALSVLVGAIINIALYSGTLLTPLFLQSIQGLSPMDSGLVLLPGSLLMALSMPIVGMLYGKVKPHFLVIAGMLIIAIGTWRMGYLTLGTPKGYVILWMSVRNIGISLAIMPATNIGMAVVSRKLTGHASAVNNWIRQAFASLSIGIFTSILSTRTVYHIKELGSSGIVGNALKARSSVLAVNDIYTLAAIILLIGIPVSFFLKPPAPEKSLADADFTPEKSA